MNRKLINFTTNEEIILPGTRRAGSYKNLGKKKPFVIINNDAGYGSYVREFVRLAQLFGLDQQNKLFRQKDITSIQQGEFIVVGDAPQFVDFDYRVETEESALYNLDGRSFRGYSIVDDFAAIIKRIESYVKANYTKSSPRKTFFGLPAPAVQQEIEVEISLERPRSVAKPTFRDLFGNAAVKKSDLNAIRNMVAFPKTNRIGIEDIAVHHNWVKIGYNQYDILEDANGTEFIVRENGDTYLISK